MEDVAAVGWGAAFLAGLLSFLSPCVLPLAPVFIAYVTGVSLDVPAGGEVNGSRRAVLSTPYLLHVLAFVSGFSAVFVVLGASATALGRALFAHQEWFARAGGVLTIFLGLLLAGVLRVDVLQRDFRVHLRRKPGGWAGSFAVGCAFGFGWTPCVGPILGSILLLASGLESLGQGVLLLSVYAAGLAVPFVAGALFLDRFLSLFRKARGFLGWTEKAAGAFLVLMGILLATGGFSRLTGWTLLAFEPWVERLVEWGI